MTETAWPFLLTRARESGHRVVVAPAFLVDAGVAGLLNELAQPTEPGAVSAREVRLSGQEPMLLVYRRFKPSAGDLGLPGRPADAPLLDRAGREFWATEGVIVVPPPPQAARTVIAREDLAHAHRDLMQSYRRMWEQDLAYTLEPSASFALTPPELVDESSKITLSEVEDPDSADTGHLANRFQAEQPVARRQTRRRLIRALAALCLLIIATVATAAYLHRRTEQQEQQRSFAGASSTLQTLCHDLKDGSVSGAYALTNSQYKAATTAQAFTAKLLGTHTNAATCAATVSSATSTSATGTLTVATASGQSQTWKVDLVGDNGNLKITAIA
jgi:hypothetical protein